MSSAEIVLDPVIEDTPSNIPAGHELLPALEKIQVRVNRDFINHGPAHPPVIVIRENGNEEKYWDVSFLGHVALKFEAGKISKVLGCRGEMDRQLPGHAWLETTDGVIVRVEKPSK